MFTFAVQLIPGGLFLIGLLFVRESPHCLLSRSCREERIKIPCWMRQIEEHDIYILKEIGTIDQTLEDPTVFKSLGVKGTNTDLFTTGLFGVVKTVGRRRLLMIGAMGSSISLWSVGAYIQIANPLKNTSGKMTSGSIAAVFSSHYGFLYSNMERKPMVGFVLTTSDTGYTNYFNQKVFEINVSPFSQTSAACYNWL
ncbi:hypothetical protein N7520_007201 [Penicillium odoratum]|uniref:uncharacterized protein n=1 Tax=Penicillium odoratum TaxID=1167516 RepID=UPI0025486B87|nr:uncharacterized protein N7520_007201 [Penicillium odoratum]KAJ5760045.1 hypothetical protein N7520_007201 [Penicillium odoratum]